MNNQIRRQKLSRGDEHLLGFTSSLFAFVLVPVILMAALGVAINIKSSEMFHEIFKNRNEAYHTYIIFVQVLSNVPVLLLVLYFARKMLKEDFKKFKKNPLRDSLLVIGCYLFSLPLVVIIAEIYKKLGIESVSDNETLIRGLLQNKYYWMMLIATVLIAPILEEMIFRKFFIGMMEEKFKFPPALAIFISILLFSFIHVPADPIFIFQYVPVAAAITLAYHFSNRNIYVAIGVHFINNFVAAVGSLFITEVLLFVFL